MISQALSSAGIAPSGVGLLEMHGTGTSLGDPIEMGAAMPVLMCGSKQGGNCGSRDTPLLLSAAKSQLGHAEPAAGGVGLMRLAAQV